MHHDLCEDKNSRPMNATNQNKGNSEQVFSTRSVDLTLARPFKAGSRVVVFQTRRVATIEAPIQASLRDARNFGGLFPGLERPGYIHADATRRKT